MTDKLRFGIIGCGRMGVRRAKTIANHTDTEIVCVADVVEGKASSLARDYKCQYFSDPMKVTTNPDVDCIIISTPNSLHLPITVAALDQKKHVFCEKPLARNPDEAVKMVEAARKNGSFLKVGSNLRFFPNVIKAKELLDSGAIGEPLFLRGWIGNNGVHLKEMWISNAEISGGGVFLDMGCHLFDLSRWFLGEVKECTGYTATLYWPVKPSEDIGMGVFLHEGGKLAFMQATWMEWADYTYLEVYGKEGYIRIDCRLPNSTTTLGTRDGQQQVFDYSRQTPQSYDLEFDHFFKAILDHRQPQPSGYDGQRAVQMAHAVYESARLGQRVKV